MTTLDPATTTAAPATTNARLASASTLGPPSPAVEPLPFYDPRACRSE